MKADKLVVLSYVIFIPLCMFCALGFNITGWYGFGVAAIIFLVVAGLGVSIFGAYSIIAYKQL